MDNQEAKCKFCGHRDEPTDRVHLVGKEYYCGNLNNCIERQLNGRRIDRDKRTLAATR